MKKFLRILLYFFLGIVALLVVFLLGFNLYYGILNSKAKSKLVEVKVLTENGYNYRDLNKNGKLDVYEDSRHSVKERVTDLLSQMTIEEKAGLMFHQMMGAGDNGQLYKKPNFRKFNFISTYDLVVNRNINHFNLLLIPNTEGLTKWQNNIQKLAEQTRLGIPITISSDPRNHYSDNPFTSQFTGDFSLWPEPIGLGAIGDSALVVKFGRIVNQEYRAVGIRTALHPMADLATEPRWGRINGTFGEDAELSAKLTAAYI